MLAVPVGGWATFRQADEASRAAESSGTKSADPVERVSPDGRAGNVLRPRAKPDFRVGVDPRLGGDLVVAFGVPHHHGSAGDHLAGVKPPLTGDPPDVVD